MATNIDKLAKNADEFNKLLNVLAASINADLSQLIRATVLKTFTKIVKESPVDTGTYRASHQIANSEPGEGEGVIESPYASKQDKGAAEAWANAKAKDNTAAWTWRPGQGSIWLFNNVPYAYRIEEGHSGQAAAGVYNVALAQMIQIFHAEAMKSKYWKGTT
ncbi:MAG TPA: hypothetical protein PLR20_14805 [Syntrophales bacterium]|nr:hypothetical protein [Syntrophales bacterium]